MSSVVTCRIPPITAKPHAAPPLNIRSIPVIRWYWWVTKANVRQFCNFLFEFSTNRGCISLSFWDIVNVSFSASRAFRLSLVQLSSGQFHHFSTSVLSISELVATFSNAYDLLGIYTHSFQWRFLFHHFQKKVIQDCCWNFGV